MWLAERFRIVDFTSTARMETELDDIAQENLSWQPCLFQWNKNFLNPAIAKAKLTIPQIPKAKANRPVIPIEYQCPVCKKKL